MDTDESTANNDPQNLPIANDDILKEYEMFSALINMPSGTTELNNASATVSNSIVREEDDDDDDNNNNNNNSSDQSVADDDEDNTATINNNSNPEQLRTLNTENVNKNLIETAVIPQSSPPHAHASATTVTKKSRNSSSPRTSTKRTRSQSSSHSSESSRRNNRDSSSRKKNNHRRRSRSSDRHYHRRRDDRRRSRSREHKRTRRSRSRDSRTHRSSRHHSSKHSSHRDSHSRQKRSRSPQPVTKKKSPYKHPSPVRTYATNRNQRKRQTPPASLRQEPRLLEMQRDEERKKAQDDAMQKLKDMAANGTLDLSQISMTDLMKTVEVPREYRTNQQTILSYQMDQVRKRIVELTGIQIPNFYNAGAVNPLQYAEQQRKRKLLWSKTNENTSTSKVGAAMTEGQDEKTAEKFRKLMGLKTSVDDSSRADAIKQINIEQQQTFDSLDKEYQVARITTHLRKGVGLGFLNSFPTSLQNTNNASSTDDKK